MDASDASDAEDDSDQEDSSEADEDSAALDPAVVLQLKCDAFARLNRRDREERAQQGLPERAFKPLPRVPRRSRPQNEEATSVSVANCLLPLDITNCKSL